MRIEAIYHWAETKDPRGPRWTDPSFSGYREFPEEVQFLLSSDKLEFEVANGGLPQFLWNTFYHWRWVLDDCERGYEMIAAYPQRLAIPEFRKLCDDHERDCRIYIFECVSTKDFQKFNDWMASASATLQSESEKLFYSGSGLQDLKQKWFAANQSRIKKLLQLE
jgi:hypothetical protein